ncbi:Polysaccharide biosynthesis protein [uncultured archaeon]|nr:Polysaccharide biosynthesis protein [uncultured archaeon]
MSTDIEKSLGTVAKGAGVIFLGLIFGNLLGIINQSLLGRFLGVDIYGTFNLAFSLVTIASDIAVFGLLGGLSRFIPFHLKKREKDIVKSSINFSFRFVLCTSILIGIILYVLSGYLSVNIFKENNLDMILKYLLISIPLLSLATILGAIIRGFKAVKYKVVVNDIGMSLSKVIIFILFVGIGYTLFGAIAAYILALIFVIFTSMIIFRKKLFPDHSIYKNVPIAKNLLAFSWPLALTGITNLFATKTDVLFIGFYLTSKDIGIYMSALVIGSSLIFVGTAYEYIFLPVVSELYAEKKISDLKILFKSASKWMFLSILIILLYIILFPKEIITLLYGAEYSEGFLALIILSFGISMNAFTGLTGNMLVAGGYTKLNLVTTVIGAIVNLSLDILLIPILGIIGAAIATSVSYSASNIFSLLFVYKTSKIHPYNMSYLKMILVSIGVLIIIYLIKTYIASFLYWPIMIILLGSLMLFLFIGLLLLTHVLDENDKFILSIIEKKLGIKLNFIRKYI